MQKTVKEGLQFREKEEGIIYTVTKVKHGNVDIIWDGGKCIKGLDVVEGWINSTDWEIIDDTPTPTERQTAEALLMEFQQWFHLTGQIVTTTDVVDDFLTSKYGKGWKSVEE